MSMLLKHRKVRRTRKPWKCDVCGGLIPAGQSIIHNTWIFEHKYYEERRHIHPCKKKVKRGSL